MIYVDLAIQYRYRNDLIKFNTIDVKQRRNSPRFCNLVRDSRRHVSGCRYPEFGIIEVRERPESRVKRVARRFPAVARRLWRPAEPDVHSGTGSRPWWTHQGSNLGPAD